MTTEHEKRKRLKRLRDEHGIDVTEIAKLSYQAGLLDGAERKYRLSESVAVAREKRLRQRIHRAFTSLWLDAMDEHVFFHGHLFVHCIDVAKKAGDEALLQSLMQIANRIGAGERAYQMGKRGRKKKQRPTHRQTK